MGYAELISKLETLPRDKQAEVFQLVESLTNKSNAQKNPTRQRAEAEAVAWNNFNDRCGAFADQHSTL